jgi:hypothetical protein
MEPSFVRWLLLEYIGMIRPSQQPDPCPVQAPQAQCGNLGKAYDPFGDRLQVIIEDMNRALTA